MHAFKKIFFSKIFTEALDWSVVTDQEVPDLILLDGGHHGPPWEKIQSDFCGLYGNDFSIIDMLQGLKPRMAMLAKMFHYNILQ